MSNQPFDPEAAGSPRGGCGKIAIIGCGGLLLLLLIGVVVFLFKAKDITVWGFGLMEQQVMARLPSETTPEEVQRIQQGFDAVVQAVHDDTVDPTALQQLQPVILRFADPNNNPQPEDVARLIELLEAAAGLSPPGAATETQPAMRLAAFATPLPAAPV